MVDRLQKLMSVSRAEFEASWRAFDASPPPTEGLPARLMVGEGVAEITFEAQAGVRLGGLLELPRAVVSFSFDGVEGQARDVLLVRFDRAFQRGGG